MLRTPPSRWLHLSARAGLTFALATLVLPTSAVAHFLWITAEAPGQPGQPTRIQVFLNEPPEPGGPEFLKFVQGVVPTTSGVPLATTTGEETVAAPWVGPLPTMVDAESDLGLKTRGEATFRLMYTARLQTEPVPATATEMGIRLRVRLISLPDGKSVIEVLYNGKPAPKAKIKSYPEAGDGAELTADDNGQLAVDGVLEGKTGLWATWTDPTPGELAGKPFGETRHYAILKFASKAATPTPASTTFATMPDPAVNSFGGAVLGDWLYVYSGHVGQTHQYSAATTAKRFRRLSLRDRTTWEDLPMGRDVQGGALVSDGRYVYRLGGMVARNQPGQPQDLVSLPDFARFDPATKAWTDLAPLPVARSTHDAAVVGRQIYAVGGWSMKGQQTTPTYLDDTVVFDLDHPDLGWKSIPQPFQRRALAVAEAGGKLYVLGGLDDAFQVTRRVDVFDPATGAWAVGPKIPGADRDGFAPSAFAVAGHLYLSGMTGTIVRLDPARGHWEAVGAWALPRITHRVLAGPDQSLLAVGGNFKGAQTSVIESVTVPASPASGAEPRAVSNR